MFESESFAETQNNNHALLLEIQPCLFFFLHHDPKRIRLKILSPLVQCLEELKSKQVDDYFLDCGHVSASRAGSLVERLTSFILNFLCSPNKSFRRNGYHRKCRDISLSKVVSSKNKLKTCFSSTWGELRPGVIRQINEISKTTKRHLQNF